MAEVDNPRLREAGQKIERNRGYRVLVRVGLVCYGLMHVIIGGLAVKLALGDTHARPSNQGAMRALAHSAWGAGLLWIAGVGFGALVVWQVLLAAFGYSEYGHRKQNRKRLASAAKVFLYGGLGVSAIRFAVGAGGGAGSEHSASAGLLRHPAGIVLLLAIGVAVGCVGGTEIYRAVRRQFNEDLDRPLHGIGAVLAMLGLTSKGIALLAVALVLCWAGLSKDAARAGGLDKGLAAIKAQPFGVPLLLIVAAGIICYGLYCFFWARHPRVAHV